MSHWEVRSRLGRLVRAVAQHRPWVRSESLSDPQVDLDPGEGTPKRFRPYAPRLAWFGLVVLLAAPIVLVHSALTPSSSLPTSSAAPLTVDVCPSGSPSPDASPSAGPSPTPAAGATVCPSPSATATPSPTTSPSPTISPTATPDVTPSPSASPNASATPSPSPSPTATATPSPSASGGS